MRYFFILSFLLFTQLIYAQLQFSDVAPVFYSKCSSCHNPDGHAASFSGYSQILPHTAQIATYLNSGYMPPWEPDTTYSRFAHERTITYQERSSILNWIANGAPAGDTMLAPSAPVPSRYQLNGTPDLELTIPSYTSSAYTTDNYICFALPTGLTIDRFIKAYEVVAGNSAIVHHIVINVDTLGTSTSDLSGTCYSSSGDITLGGYAPGGLPTIFPSQAPLKMGLKLKAGSNIILQIHYAAGSGGLTDSTKIRLYFYPPFTSGIRAVHIGFLKNNSLNIPANTIMAYNDRYPGGCTLPSAISLFSIFPHSHYLATRIITCAYSGSDTIPVIKINKWDPDWQSYYTFRSLIKIPPGYRLFAKHIFDNTANNPKNPNSPPVDVSCGHRTIDEMFNDAFQWIDYLPGDEYINIDSLILNTSVTTGMSSKSDAQFSVSIYPNPSEGNINIEYLQEADACKTSINVYSVYGEQIWSLKNNDETRGYHKVVWDGKSNNGTRNPPGTYIIVIHSGLKQYERKIILF